MKVYAISYDLKSPDRDYTPLYDAIKNNYQWWHYLESTWLVATSETAQQIYGRLVKTITQADRLIIIKVTKEYYGWLPADAWKWIESNLTE